MASILRIGTKELCRTSCFFSIHHAVPKRCFNLSRIVNGVSPMELLMPALSPTMEVGTIKKWLKEEGEIVSVGDALCEVETDKATVIMDADEDGIMAKIMVGEGAKDVKINTLIALMVAEGEDYKDVDVPSHVSDSAVQEPDSVGVSQKTSVRGPSLSPAVRYLIETHTIDPQDIQPTGPNNRILKGDILKYMSTDQRTKVESQPILTPPPPPEIKTSPIVSQPSQRTDVKLSSNESYNDLEVSNMRKIIARRLTESKSTVPHSYATIECTIDSILKLRKTFARGHIKLSVNDFIIKAAAMALKEHPDVNAQWSGEDVVRMTDIGISVAVATKQGLITPIVTDAASKGLSQISQNVRDLASRAREGKLQLHEFQGGSFSISNLGMFGVGEFSAVINPPQACILAVGSSKMRLSETNQARTVMTLTLSSDARVVDDALAANFLQSVKSNLEKPMRLGLL